MTYVVMWKTDDMLPWEIEHVLTSENGFEVHVRNVSKEGLLLESWVYLSV